MKNDESITFSQQEASQNTGELSEELLAGVQGGSALGEVVKIFETISPGPGIAKWRKALTAPETSAASSSASSAASSTSVRLPSPVRGNPALPLPHVPPHG